MALRSSLIFLIVVCLLLPITITGARPLSRDDEDLELEKEVARLNKPAIITIQTLIGETYDCVDFYKQPAFDNPLLKKHKFKPEISVLLHQYSRSQDDPIVREFQNMWKNGKGCPVGSVPIKRTTKDDLIRGRLDTQRNQPGYFSGLRTTLGLKSYNGASMNTSIHQPQVGQVGQGLRSASRLKLQNNLDFIEAGWMASPDVFGDSLTRFYIHQQVGETRCYNTQCGLFVGSSPSVPIGAIFPNISQPGGPTYILPVSIQKNVENGNWDLMVGQTNHLLGWWTIPKASGLSGWSAHIEWGGEVYSPPTVATPPMGAGLHFLKGREDTDASCDNVMYTSMSGEKVNAGVDVVERYSDITNTDFYAVDDLGLRDNKRLVYFGGPGGYRGT